MRTKNSKYATSHQRSLVNRSISDDSAEEPAAHREEGEGEGEVKPTWMTRHPETWTREEVGQWIDWCTSEFSLPKIARGGKQHFEMNGRGLLMLTVEMFKERVPTSGDILFSALTNMLPPDQQLKRQQQETNVAIKPDFSRLLEENEQESPKHLPSQGASSSSSRSASNHIAPACSKQPAKHKLNSSSSSSNKSTAIAQSDCSAENNNNNNDELVTTLKDHHHHHESSSTTTTTTTKRKRSNSSAEPDKEMKETAVLTNFVPNPSSCKENNARLKDIDVGELKLQSNPGAESNDRKRHLSPAAASAQAASQPVVLPSPTSNVVERKRTLESLVDTLKVRKQNQTSPPEAYHHHHQHHHKSKHSNGSSGAGGGKMSSIYVDIAASMSDCSPSTPPLSSSPSVSPSSLSIAPDSPGHVSSSSSYPSSVANLINQALVAAAAANQRNSAATSNTGIGGVKPRWLIDFANEIGVVVNDSNANANNNNHHLNSNAKSSSSSSSSSSYTASSSKSSSPSSSTLNSKTSTSAHHLGVNSSRKARKTNHNNSNIAPEEPEEEEELDEGDLELERDDQDQENWTGHQDTAADEMYDDDGNMVSMMTTDEHQDAAEAEYLEEVEDELEEPEEEEEDDDDSYVETKKSKAPAKGRAAVAAAPKVKVAAARGVGKAGQDSKVKFYDDYIDFKGDILRRPPNSKNCRILWEYLYLLLQNPNYASVIRWEDEANMVFRIVQAEKLASLWGLQKNRLGMTYEKLSRGMRYYYPNNIIAREPGRRLLYRFMRHPDEIKKFVKKDGKYMLKRGAKLSGEGGEDETGSIDEDGIVVNLPKKEHPTPAANVKPNHSKVQKAASKTTNQKNTYQADYETSTPDEDENNNNYLENEDEEDQEDDNQTSGQLFDQYKQNLANGENNHNRFMPDLSPFYQQIMAAAAAAHMSNSYLPQQRFSNEEANNSNSSLTSQLLYHLRNQQQDSAANSSTTSSSSSNGANSSQQVADQMSSLANQFLLNETIKNFSNSINLQRPASTCPQPAKGNSSYQAPMTGAAAASAAAKQKRLNKKLLLNGATGNSTPSSTSQSSASSASKYDLRATDNQHQFLNSTKYNMANFLLAADHQTATGLNKKRKNKNDIN